MLPPYLATEDRFHPLGGVTLSAATDPTSAQYSPAVFQQCHQMGRNDSGEPLTTIGQIDNLPQTRGIPGRSASRSPSGIGTSVTTRTYCHQTTMGEASRSRSITTMDVANQQTAEGGVASARLNSSRSELERGMTIAVPLVYDHFSGRNTYWPPDWTRSFRPSYRNR